jgi:hypothetical protein
MRFLPLIVVLLAGCSSAPKHSTSEKPVRGMPDLVRMDRCQLDALYRQCEVGTPPCGVMDGRAIINAGSPMTVPTACVVSLMWQGKVVGTEEMINRVFGFRAVKAKVYLGESWVDGKPAMIFDYAGTSKMFPAIRDEVREVSPGLYLGVTHERTDSGPKFKTFFTLAPKK